jgi:hypothetical protein
MSLLSAQRQKNRKEMVERALTLMEKGEPNPEYERGMASLIAELTIDIDQTASEVTDEILRTFAEFHEN